MNRTHRPPPALFSHLDEPVVTPPSGEGAVCHPVFSSAVSGAATTDDVAVPGANNQ